MTIEQRIRVPVGFAYGALFLYFAQPVLIWFVLGTGIASAGLALRIWATGHLEKWRGLAVSGPYRHTRNPLYLGSFVMGLGLAAAGSVLWLAALFAALFFAFYLPVMRREEQELRQSYGSQAQAYIASKPLFRPSWDGGLPPQLESANGGRKFLWKRVLENREYNAVIGFLILDALIFIKML